MWHHGDAAQPPSQARGTCSRVVSLMLQHSCTHCWGHVRMSGSAPSCQPQWDGMINTAACKGGNLSAVCPAAAHAGRSILVVSVTDHFLWRDHNFKLLVASFGASAVLLYGVPESKLSQPRNLIGEPARLTRQSGWCWVTRCCQPEPRVKAALLDCAYSPPVCSSPSAQQQQQLPCWLATVPSPSSTSPLLTTPHAALTRS